MPMLQTMRKRGHTDMSSEFAESLQNVMIGDRYRVSSITDKTYRGILPSVIAVGRFLYARFQAAGTARQWRRCACLLYVPG
jgi:hypothetical protein